MMFLVRKVCLDQFAIPSNSSNNHTAQPPSEMIIGILRVEVLVTQPGIEAQVFVSVALDELVLPIEDLGLDRHLGFDIQVHNATVAVVTLRGILR